MVYINCIERAAHVQYVALPVHACNSTPSLLFLRCVCQRKKAEMSPQIALKNSAEWRPHTRVVPHECIKHDSANVCRLKSEMC